MTAVTPPATPPAAHPGRWLEFGLAAHSTPTGAEPAAGFLDLSGTLAP